MLTDVAGKVRNLKLRPNERLIPLFEAIVNSIQASKENAHIDISLIRQTSQIVTDEESEQLQEVEKFIIKDFGVGFTPENLESFRTAESSFKADLGCKGVGRFTWLKVFDKIDINSIYYHNGEYYNVLFNFTVDDESLDNIDISNLFGNHHTPSTTVTLSHPKQPFKDKLPIEIDDYCDEIIRHCITYFIDGKFKKFTISDNTGKEIDLLEYFRVNHSSDIIENTVTIGEHSFKTSYVKTYNRQRTHKIFFCANSRTVKDYNISSYVDDIPDHFTDGGNLKFRYSLYVSSNYLDSNLNQERTNFSIAEKDDLLDESNPCMEKIIAEIIIGNSIFLDYLAPMKKENLIRIKNYTEHKGYEYRFLLKHKPEWIEKIKIGLNDDELDAVLHRLFRDFEYELKNEAIKIKREMRESKVLSSGKYKDAYEKYTTALNDIGMSNLSRYVVHRKSIIDIFELSLELQENDKHALESAVHDIIFPMNSTSDDTTHISQNLWMIDERMSYHTLLASDQPFNKFSDVDDNRRPDILIFNNPMVFSDNEKQTSTATIIEFKRPMRDDYTDEENPIKQVIGYVKKLREPNAVKTAKGRVITLNTHVPIYCYIVCDLTKTIREFAADHDYISTPDNEGFIWYHKKLNAYLEIISFDKLAADARKRNNILFKLLNIE